MVSANLDQILSLVKLQESELKLVEIKKSLENIPDRINELENSLVEFEKKVADKNKQVADLNKEYRVKEAEFNDNLNNIEKSKEKLIHVKTNKEYEAVLKAVKAFKEKNTENEDIMLDNLDKIEKYEQNIKLIEIEFAEFKNHIKSKKKEIESEHDRKIKERESLSSNCEKISKDINADLLDMYYKIIRLKGNFALSRVVDSRCSGCDLNIPPQMYNELQRDRDTLTFCPYCYRIIYWKKD